VDEGSLGVHQIKLVIQTGPGLGNGGGVAQHAHGTLYLGQVTSWDNGWWLVVDTDL
jgi:predicted trehalose synthase